MGEGGFRSYLTILLKDTGKLKLLESQCKLTYSLALGPRLNCVCSQTAPDPRGRINTHISYNPTWHSASQKDGLLATAALHHQQAKIHTCFLFFFFLNIMNVYQYKRHGKLKSFFHIHCNLFFHHLDKV